MVARIRAPRLDHPFLVRTGRWPDRPQDQASAHVHIGRCTSRILSPQLATLLKHNVKNLGNNTSTFPPYYLGNYSFESALFQSSSAFVVVEGEYRLRMTVKMAGAEIWVCQHSLALETSTNIGTTRSDVVTLHRINVLRR